jgi:hypothetical protein
MSSGNDHSDDADPGGDQQPDHQLADEAESDDTRGIAELDLGRAARRAWRSPPQWRRRHAPAKRP